MLQEGFEKKVTHAEFRVFGISLMESDGRDDKRKLEGIKLARSVPIEDEAKKAFEAFVEGGTVAMPLAKTFWSPIFGMLTDRFGLEWMISVPGPM